MGKPTDKKVPVSPRALMQRINRKLREKEHAVKKSRPYYDQGRGPYYNNNLGEYYVLDLRTNTLLWVDINLENLGREEGAMAPWETLAAE